MKRNKIFLLFLCMNMALNSVFSVNAMEKPAEAEQSAAETEDMEDTEFAEAVAEANEKLKELTGEKDVLALVYLCDRYAVKAEPESGAADIAEVVSGQQVRIREAVFSEGKIWYLTDLTADGCGYSGYIEKEYLAYSDEDFIAWEEENLLPMFPDVDLYADGQRDVEQFPAGYQKFLSGVKKAYPNWTFVKFDTGLDWNTVVAEEMKEARSLVPSSSPEEWKRGDYGGGWSYASQGALKYYLDPRNFLNENYMFQFEQLTFNKSYHTEAAIQKFLNATFMAGKIPEDTRTYAAAFWEIGNQLGVSPFHLAARVYQEQGAGKSALISGNYPGYEGLYNYYNIGATGSSDEEEIVNGLERARQEGWTTRYLSLEGGARILSQNYILAGQDTLYLQKFDVDKSANGLYWHQYMQNICAPANEGLNIRKLYQSTNSLNNTFVFKIPVYANMPAEPCKIDSISEQLNYYAPVFDPNYYMSHCTDLKKYYGTDVAKYLKHFKEYGMKEGRQGSEEFNAKIYSANYSDLSKYYGSNWERYYEHYLKSGKKEGRNGKTLLPSVSITVYNGRDYKDVFDAQYYTEKYKDLRDAYGYNSGKLLKHFAEYGMKEGRQGKEEFSAQIYAANYGDLKKYYGNNWSLYYDHYMRAGKKEGRNGKILLNTVYGGRDYKDVFNAEYYMNRCADLKKYYGNDSSMYLKHFAEHGMKEGRQGSEEFNVKIYSERYPDLRKYYGTHWELYYDHYMRAGKAEGRSGR